MIPKILKGDDTNANGKSITITYPAGQYVGLRLEFAFLGHKKVSANLDKHGGSFTIDFTAEQTKVMPLGTHFASMALLDSADRRYTITNTLKLLVTDDVAFAYDGESNNISLDVTVTGGIPDLSDVNTAPQTPNALVNSFKEVVDRLNAARPVLASALLSLASLCAFGFGVTPKTAPLGDVKFTDGVVTGVTFSSEGLLIDNAQMLTNSANFRLAVKATVPSVEGAAEIATNAAKYIAASASITNAGAVAYADTLVSNKVDKTQNKNGLTYQLPAYSVLCPVRNTSADEWYEAYFDVGNVQYIVGCDVGHYVSSHNGYADDYLYIIPKYVYKNGLNPVTITATNCLYYTMSARSGAIEVHGEVCSNAVLNVGAIQSDPVITIPDNLVRYIKPKITLFKSVIASYYKVEFCGFTANNVQNGVPRTNRELKCNTPLAELAISGNFTTEPTIADYVSGVLWNSSVLPTVFERYFIPRCWTTPISSFINDSGYQTEVQTRGIVSNVVTKAYVEDLGISGGGAKVIAGRNIAITNVASYSNYAYKELGTDVIHYCKSVVDTWNPSASYVSYLDEACVVMDGGMLYGARAIAETVFWVADGTQTGNPCVVTPTVVSSDKPVAVISTTNLCTYSESEAIATSKSTEVVNTLAEGKMLFVTNKFVYASSPSTTNIVSNSSIEFVYGPYNYRYRVEYGAPTIDKIRISAISQNGYIRIAGYYGDHKTFTGDRYSPIAFSVWGARTSSDWSGNYKAFSDRVISDRFYSMFDSVGARKSYVDSTFTPLDGTVEVDWDSPDGLKGLSIDDDGVYIKGMVIRDGLDIADDVLIRDGNLELLDGAITLRDGGIWIDDRHNLKVDAPENITFISGNLNTLFARKTEIVSKSEVTNTVNAVKEQFYDQPLQVNWTMRMVNGEMKLYATTNTNQSVLQ